MLYIIQIFKMAAIATTVYRRKQNQEIGLLSNNQNSNFKTNVKRDKIVFKMLTDHCDVLVIRININLVLKKGKRGNYA